MAKTSVNVKAELQALPIVAKALGRTLGITVLFKGNQAYTDGRTIVLPALKMMADERELGLVQGYLDHEAAHIRYTDFKVETEWCTKNQYPKQRRAILHLVANVLEDIRIEQLLPREYPGTKLHLTRLATALAADVKLTDYDEQYANEKPLMLMIALAHTTLRADSLKCDALQPLKHHLYDLANNKLGTTLVTEALAIALAGSKAWDTLGVVEASAKFLTLLAAAEAEERQNAQNNADGDSAEESDGEEEGEGEGESGGESEGSGAGTGKSKRKGKGKGKGNGDGDGDDEDDADSACGGEGAEAGGAGAGAGEGKSEGGGNPGKKKGKTGAKPSSTQTGEPTKQPGDSAAKKTLAAQANEGLTEDEVAADADQAGLDISKKAAGELSDKSQKQAARGRADDRYTDTRPIVTLQPDYYALTALKTEALTRKLRIMLENALEARTLAEEYSGTDGIRLNARMLAGTKVGNFSVFNKVEEGLSYSTAISLLIDKSGSMSGYQMQGAQRAAIAIGTAMNTLNTQGAEGVVFSIDMFDSVHGEVKDFDEPWTKATAAKVAAIPATGGTTYAQPIVRRSGELLARKETRKVLIVLTDGEPCDGEAAKQVLAYIRKQGIETIALILDGDQGLLDFATEMFAQVVSVRQPEKLPAALGAILLKNTG